MNGFISKTYVICDPRNNSPFYVGKTAFSLEGRLYCHITSSKYKNTSITGLKNNMIQSIISDGMMPKIELLKITNIPIMGAYYESYFYNKFLIEGYSMLQMPLKYGSFNNFLSIVKRNRYDIKYNYLYNKCSHLPILLPDNL